MPKAALGPIRLIRLGKTAAWKTQAVYHALAERMTADSPDTIILCRPASPYVCLGYHQMQNVLDRSACERLGLPIIRRQVGGGATYLDSEQIFYQCVFHHSHLPASFREIYTRLLMPPVSALRRLGLDATLRDTNEIEVGGKRIAGTGGGQIGEAGVVVGNILFEFDCERMAQLWRVPSESFRELGLEALRERILTLRELLPGATFGRVEDLLIEEYAGSLGRSLRLDRLTRDERKCAREVAKLLGSPRFLSLHEDGTTRDTPPRPLKISAGVYIHSDECVANGLSVRGSFRVRDGVIERARLDGGPEELWREMEQRLAGIPFSEWRERIALLPAQPDHEK